MAKKIYASKAASVSKLYVNPRGWIKLDRSVIDHQALLIGIKNTDGDIPQFALFQRPEIIELFFTLKKFLKDTSVSSINHEGEI